MRTTPQWLLRRFASRALELLERHQNRAPALGIHSETIQKSASEFISTFDSAQAFDQALSEAFEHRSAASDNLARNMRAWTAVLVNDLKGFDSTRYGDKPEVAVDVIDDAEALLVFLADYAEDGGTPPPYTDTLKQDMEALIEAAKADLKVATSRSARLSELRTLVRQKAVKFHRDLIAFRRALKALVGSNHPDYQALRVVRGAELSDIRSEELEGDPPQGDVVDPVEDEADVEAASEDAGPQEEDVAEAS
jgi:hypothetical protein